MAKKKKPSKKCAKKTTKRRVKRTSKVSCTKVTICGNRRKICGKVTKKGFRITSNKPA